MICRFIGMTYPFPMTVQQEVDRIHGNKDMRESSENKAHRGGKDPCAKRFEVRCLGTAFERCKASGPIFGMAILVWTRIRA